MRRIDNTTDKLACQVVDWLVATPVARLIASAVDTAIYHPNHLANHVLHAALHDSTHDEFLTLVITLLKANPSHALYAVVEEPPTQLMLDHSDSESTWRDISKRMSDEPDYANYVRTFFTGQVLGYDLKDIMSFIEGDDVYGTTRYDEDHALYGEVWWDGSGYVPSRRNKDSAVRIIAAINLNRIYPIPFSTIPKQK